ncbi:hypothetical protein DPEC_G00185330 [Dallia pectoralis]|uniref:Uncharacterized protein n=1 Tax=Dallia pectoralis TaxID=75939 RepID=A0ACC2GB52_DALPE|nr:hypothetical protein DPEC_G00185330 [Dallia pectoralis]
MWSVWMLLLGFAVSVGGYWVPDQQYSLSHGGQLKIDLPTTAESLEFIPADEPLRRNVFWERGALSDRISKGMVSGKGTDKRWFLDAVTFENQGNYVLKNLWKKEISSLKLSVTMARVYEKCVAGEALSIPLAGMSKTEAFLIFSGASANVSLVTDGAVVAQDLPDYWNRVTIGNSKIKIQNVNTSDVGTYILKDRRNRVVSVVKMELTDKHEYEGNPLLALLLLLGIPAGICCCCRKKIFKKKTQYTTTTVVQDGTPVAPPPGPTSGGGVYPGPGEPGGYSQGHPPPNPGVPNQPQWTGPPPQPGFSPMYPPAQPQQWNGPPPNPTQDPMYPPAQPQQWNGPPPNPTQDPMYPPAQPQQWNGPEPSQPLNHPSALAMGYTPVTYNALSSGEEIKMANRFPADPLLPAQPPPGVWS